MKPPGTLGSQSSRKKGGFFAALRSPRGSRVAKATHSSLFCQSEGVCYCGQWEGVCNKACQHGWSDPDAALIDMAIRRAQERNSKEKVSALSDCGLDDLLFDLERKREEKVPQEGTDSTTVSSSASVPSSSGNGRARRKDTPRKKKQRRSDGKKHNPFKKQTNKLGRQFPFSTFPAAAACASANAKKQRSKARSRRKREKKLRVEKARGLRRSPAILQATSSPIKCKRGIKQRPFLGASSSPPILQMSPTLSPARSTGLKGKPPASPLWLGDLASVMSLQLDAPRSTPQKIKLVKEGSDLSNCYEWPSNGSISRRSQKRSADHKNGTEERLKAKPPARKKRSERKFEGVCEWPIHGGSCGLLGDHTVVTEYPFHELPKELPPLLEVNEELFRFKSTISYASTGSPEQNRALSSPEQGAKKELANDQEKTDLDYLAIHWPINPRIGDKFKEVTRSVWL